MVVFNTWCIVSSAAHVCRSFSTPWDVFANVCEHTRVRYSPRDLSTTTLTTTPSHDGAAGADLVPGGSNSVVRALPMRADTTTSSPLAESRVKVAQPDSGDEGAPLSNGQLEIGRSELATRYNADTAGAPQKRRHVAPIAESESSGECAGDESESGGVDTWFLVSLGGGVSLLRTRTCAYMRMGWWSRFGFKDDN